MLLVFLACLISVLFAEIYSFLNQYILADWLSAASVNSIFALVVLYFLYKNRKTKTPEIAHSSYLQQYRAYIPSAVILIAVVLGATITSFIGERETLDVNMAQLAWIFWIPVVEELVFRIGVGNYLRSISNVMWGSYFSVFVFAFVHSGPTVERLLEGSIGIPLGPLLLGVFCEFIYLKSGRLLPAIVFHGVCNSSAVLYSLIDARWLSWLEGLYQ